MNERSLPSLPCLCANLRRAARALTQRYDEALRPLGITITQFTILQALSLAGKVSQGRLGEILAMDSTTLTRTLAIMSKHGWIASQAGADRRERRLGMSAAGKLMFNRALPHWQRAQSDLRARFGLERWNNLMNATNDVTSAVTQ
jgi:DNA-binding MarR family transcriptional regulator